MQKITFSTVKRGKWSKKQTAETIYVDIKDSENFIGQFSVSSHYSIETGISYKSEAREKSLINITCTDKTILSLTWEELEQAARALKGGSK
jgi:hypothetical protein